MIRDLNGLNGILQVDADVCVVGGGMAGLLIADKLKRCGVRAIVLESGDVASTPHANELNDVVSASRPYVGATLGRSRRLGGTSSIWGGSLIPFLEQDLEERAHLGLRKWPISLADIAEDIRDVESVFGVSHSAYDSDQVVEASIGAGAVAHDGDFVLRCAKWPPFGRLNVAQLLAQSLKSQTGVLIWVNATVTSIEASTESGRASDVVARSPSGGELRVSALRVVLCGGAIETTRLLLLLDRQTNGAAFRGCRALGKYFFDHLSMPAANLQPRDLTLLNRMAGYRWEGNTMRSLRFELAPSTQLATGSPSSFGHIAMETETTTPLDILRDAFRGYQRTGQVRLGGLTPLFNEFGYLIRAGMWRAFNKRLLWPAGAKCSLHIVSEQIPREQNSITLAEARDFYGIPRPRIDWSVTSADTSSILAYARRFDGYWKRSTWQRAGELQWNMRLDREMLDVPVMDKVVDIFHPGGTTRMGFDSVDAVVDRDLSVFAVPNISIASTSVFPAGASANPSLTLMALSLRLARHLAKKFGRA